MVNPGHLAENQQASHCQTWAFLAWKSSRNTFSFLFPQNVHPQSTQRSTCSDKCHCLLKMPYKGWKRKERTFDLSKIPPDWTKPIWRNLRRRKSLRTGAEATVRRLFLVFLGKFWSFTFPVGACHALISSPSSTIACPGRERKWPR